VSPNLKREWTARTFSIAGKKKLEAVTDLMGEKFQLEKI
jgi:hypothetical protein